MPSAENNITMTEKLKQNQIQACLIKILQEDEVTEKECETLVEAFKESKISGKQLLQLLDKHKYCNCRTQFNQNIIKKTHIIENTWIAGNDSNGPSDSVTCTCTCGHTATINIPYRISSSSIKSLDQILAHDQR